MRSANLLSFYLKPSNKKYFFLCLVARKLFFNCRIGFYDPALSVNHKLNVVLHPLKLYNLIIV